METVHKSKGLVVRIFMIFKILGFVCASLSLHFLGTAVPIVVWCFLFCPYLLITQWSIAETVSSLTFSLCSLWLNSFELKSSMCWFSNCLTFEGMLNGFIQNEGEVVSLFYIIFFSIKKWVSSLVGCSPVIHLPCAELCLLKSFYILGNFVIVPAVAVDDLYMLFCNYTIWYAIMQFT